MHEHCPTCLCRTGNRPNHRRDPRWLLATAEVEGPYPDLIPSSRNHMEQEGLRRVVQVETIYELGMPDAEVAGVYGYSIGLIFAKPINKPNAGLAKFDPEHHDNLWRRIVYYQVLLVLSRYPDARAVVKALAESRREWLRLATLTRTAMLGNRYASAAPGPRVSHLARLKRAVIRRGGSCTYCGVSEPNHVDHIIPIARGGRDHLWNLTISCEVCNLEKRVWTPLEWRAARLTKGLPWPPPIDPVVVEGRP